jgi:hypothetical protein
MDPKYIKPEIDTGSDTLARFHYQSEVTLPFCIRCALDKDIISVIPEHLEDIAIEMKDKWRFIQVKSRNPELGLWRLSYLTESGGALRSLYRTYKQIQDVEASLELILEGALKPNDTIENLKSDGDHNNPILISSVAKGLSITVEESTSFLNHVLLLSPPVSRQNIKDSNLRLLHEQNPSLNHNDITEIYNQLVAEIERAMRAEPLGFEWPQYVIHPDKAIPEMVKKVEAKRLTQTHLQKIVASLTLPPTRLLKRITGSDTTSISLLERKLIQGGATDEIIENARYLRSNAEYRLFDYQSRSLFSSKDLLDDLNIRLQTYINAKKALYLTSPRPAIETWNSLLTEFSDHASVIDPNGIMNADPMLLLGGVCELANACVVDWGTSNAK